LNHPKFDMAQLTHLHHPSWIKIQEELHSSKFHKTEITRRKLTK
jgi:hypothetical protein